MVENKTDNIDSQINRPREGSGSLLASARKAQNKSVEEIAAELNLSITQIKTIELDQSEGLPEPTYVRGYIRSYARLLGLDSEKILESYLNPNWQKSSSLDEMPKGIANADDIKGRRFLTPGKIITLLIVLSIAAFLWFSGLFSSLLSSFDTPKIQSSTQVLETDEPSLRSPAVNVENAALLESSSNNTNNSSTINNIETNASQIVDENSPSKETTENDQSENTTEEGQVSNGSGSIDSTVDNQAVTETQTGHNLILTFVETCWVDIRDNNDKRLAYKSYRVGDELVVSNDQVLNVFLGNAEGVKATYNGEPFDMSPYREGVYAKFSLGKN